ncbi:DNA polymerase IV [Rhodothalassium salexigens]|uniref:DNA polymerase IV n=1 Tax=Rhodothalassium salexigens TaxID=1086 RepID=UPI0019140316|nr:DNA polymerase IV [Rhodothalassium salexigens]MBK5911922.1 DNA polymerase IV [Rhodothalassium salexigens]
MAATTSLCQDCGHRGTPDGDRGRRCAACGSPRLVRHDELDTLAIAHLDCDAFYAAVEKRDDPSLETRPVIVGGGRRGVVATACYVARTYGVHSAMPMFKALKACPHAVVIRPDMAKYAAVSAQIRAAMTALTPAVEPLSIDEAFLDLSGTERLHGRPPADMLVALQRRIERDIGVTASIGLSHNKFLAKLASDFRKPRGFAVIGRAETRDVLAPLPVSAIWGVGRALRAKLAADGIRTIADLRALDEATLMRRHGTMGRRLYRLARGEDARSVTPERAPKSVSSETTLAHDLSRLDALEPVLWTQCERLSTALKRKRLAGGTVVLKLKTADHRLRTRSHALDEPTQLAHRLYDATRPLLAQACDGRTAFRLIGVGVDHLGPPDRADGPDLIDTERAKRTEVERAMDKLRNRFGDGAVRLGRALTARGVAGSDPDPPENS